MNSDVSNALPAHSDVCAPVCEVRRGRAAEGRVQRGGREVARNFGVSKGLCACFNQASNSSVILAWLGLDSSAFTSRVFALDCVALEAEGTTRYLDSMHAHVVLHVHACSK